MDYTTRAKLEKAEDGEFADQMPINRNFDRLDYFIGSTWVTSTTRPANPFVGQKIWESDTGQERLWNGVRWIWIGGLRPHGRLVHDNGLQQNLSAVANNTTPVTAYSTDLEGGFTVSGTPGGGDASALHLVVPEDGRYRVDMVFLQGEGAAGARVFLCCVNANVQQYDVIRIEREANLTYQKRGSFTARFSKGHMVRMGAFRVGGDAANGVQGTAGNYESTAMEMTYEGV